MHDNLRNIRIFRFRFHYFWASLPHNISNLLSGNIFYICSTSFCLALLCSLAICTLYYFLGLWLLLCFLNSSSCFHKEKIYITKYTWYSCRSPVFYTQPLQSVLIFLPLPFFGSVVQQNKNEWRLRVAKEDLQERKPQNVGWEGCSRV